MNMMSTTSRIVIALGSLAMIIMYFVPAWSIYLVAPQYPEGLSMQIWLYKLSGEVEIINGLNHYIGMKHIKAEMFPEFSYLVYILGAYILFGLVIAVTGNRKLLFVYLILSVIGGVAALVDFYLWGYDYGHNLDPTAAIQVPGLSYQPPVIGHKKLLNFDSYSLPDTGGWIVVAVTGVFFVIWVLEKWRQKQLHQAKPQKVQATFALAALIILSASSCNPEPEKINPGKDNCAECKMSIMQPAFAAEIVTKKGKIFKFDDAHCLAIFLKKEGVELSDIHQTLFADYNKPDEFVRARAAEFVVSSRFKTPMGGNAAAFKNKAEAAKKSEELEGSKMTNWATLYNILVK